MASILQEAKWNGLLAYLPAVSEGARLQQEIYRENCHRIYSLAFWMTDNELAAEDVMENTFRRAFAANGKPSMEAVDRALVAELRETIPLGSLTLRCEPPATVVCVRRNVKRVHLERAVVQLPPTERLAFLLHDMERCHHTRIARVLGMTVEQSQMAVHQARLRLRELVARTEP